MKIGILASGGLGFHVLKKLPHNTDIAFIATDPGSLEIIDYSISNDIPLFTGNPRNGKLKEFLSGLNKPKIALSINYLFLIENDIISSFSDIINFHGSLLPKYRGRTPHVWSIINNEKFTGITAHKVDEGCDTGPILKQVRIPIKYNYTGNDILLKFKELYPKLVEEIINLAEADNLIYKTQDEKIASFFGKRTPEDGLINWNWQRERIYNWVRAQSNPYPGAYTYYKDKKIVIDKVKLVSFSFNYKQENGLVLGKRNNNLIVKTPNGALEILSIRNIHVTEVKNGSILS